MKIFTTLCILILVSVTTFAQVSENEKQALIDLYTATDGNNWNTTWNFNTPVKEWHGVTVKDNQVTQINLMFNNLKGELPASLGQLANLESIEFSFNQINGVLPGSLGTLESLKTLAINSNQLKGAIPSSLGNLVQLEQLHLSSNLLTGVIPATLGNLEHLEILNVFDNNLTGTIPLTILESDNLKKLVLAENEIIVTDALADVILFKIDNQNTRFITPNSFKDKTVIAIETNDDNN